MRVPFILMVIIGAIGCQNQTPSSPAGTAAPEPELLSFFEEMGPGDTLFVGYDQEMAGADSIPVPMLWMGMDSMLLQQIAYGPDSSTMVARGEGRWVQDSANTACLMRVDQFWWKFQYALIYDRQKGVFTGIQPLAEFYGGEGGQVATVSWLFDRDGDGDRDIISRTSEHFLEMLSEDAEPVEHISEEVYVWEWTNGGFQPVAGIDSAALVKAWPVEWGW